MSSNDYSPTDDEMQRFTATGRPFQPLTKSDKHAMTMNAFTSSESRGQAPPNLLPQRYTDESFISVPVMRPEDMGKHEGHKSAKTSFWTSRRKSNNDNFIIKQISRGEYLKRYAKDEAGKYVGTEDPAPDCILRGEDADRHRKKALEYRHEIGSKPDKGVDTYDGIIR